MDKKIKKILEDMEKQSEIERTKTLEIPSEDRMLAITMDTGKFFNMLLQMIDAKNILEIGTSTGYSTIWLADAIMGKKGKIITIEKNPNKITRARRNFEKAGILKKIEIREGNASEVLAELTKQGLQGHFDFALIDADKEECIKYFDMILPMIRKNGVIATDNMLYPEKYRPEMQKFHDHVEKNSKVISVIVPIGNGEEITLKTKI